jgi:hypothetical protein
MKSSGERGQRRPLGIIRQGSKHDALPQGACPCRGGTGARRNAKIDELIVPVCVDNVRGLDVSVDDAATMYRGQRGRNGDSETDCRHVVELSFIEDTAVERQAARIFHDQPHDALGLVLLQGVEVDDVGMLHLAQRARLLEHAVPVCSPDTSNREQLDGNGAKLSPLMLLAREPDRREAAMPQRTHQTIGAEAASTRRPLQESL